MFVMVGHLKTKVRAMLSLALNFKADLLFPYMLFRLIDSSIKARM